MQCTKLFDLLEPPIRSKDFGAFWSYIIPGLSQSCRAGLGHIKSMSSMDTCGEPKILFSPSTFGLPAFFGVTGVHSVTAIIQKVREIVHTGTLYKANSDSEFSARLGY